MSIKMSGKVYNPPRVKVLLYLEFEKALKKVKEMV